MKFEVEDESFRIFWSLIKEKKSKREGLSPFLSIVCSTSLSESRKYGGSCEREGGRKEDHYHNSSVIHLYDNPVVGRLC